MDDLIRRVSHADMTTAGPEPLSFREWLVTNGLGGYASGTLANHCTRRYHGLLIAALPAPWGRVVMLNDLWEVLEMPSGAQVRLGGERQVGSLSFPDAALPSEFRLELGLPVWRYEAETVVLERRVYSPYRQNTVYVHYRLLSGEGTVRLRLRPGVNFRPQGTPVDQPLARPYTLTCMEDGRFELSAPGELPPLRLRIDGENGTFSLDKMTIPGVFYSMEQGRGYPATGELWSPGCFQVELSRDREAALVASVDEWEILQALSPAEALEAERLRRRQLLAAAQPAAQSGTALELVLAADQFIIRHARRGADAARALATGDEFCSVIAGYYWFADWGRDTMIGLEGLTLATGRFLEARHVLRTFADYVRDGLIPNMFPEGGRDGVYNTADATLWFFHALQRYLDYTGDRLLLRQMLPKLLEIVERHRQGTRFGIAVDSRDGLLREGQEGLPLTWMDAKVGDWVVTPRRGKAVEINALWYNALCLLADWVRQEQREEAARPWVEQAERVRRSFNERFWFSAGEYCYDVVDGEQGDDSALRPNQVLAISLQHPVLDPARWPAVLEAVSRHLLTPVGLRSLAPEHPEYKAEYFGNRRERDAAYHQGTIWPWLIGPFVDAWLKLYPDDIVGARTFLDGFEQHLGEACIGSISEVFDPNAPFTPHGCVAQAWSVAEVLRAWAKTATG